MPRPFYLPLQIHAAVQRGLSLVRAACQCIFIDLLSPVLANSSPQVVAILGCVRLTRYLRADLRHLSVPQSALQAPA